MSLQGWLVLLLLGISSATSCPDGRKCEDHETCCTSADGTSACCPPAIAVKAVKAVMCPDQESECPDETTCCQLPDQTWGCCPMAKAVCCEDKRHCCPEGTQCDLSHSRCVSPVLGHVALLEKLPARRKSVASMTCPGGKSRCPDGATCCLLTSGVYSCCPHPEAVCCSDLLHCCPANTTCDLEQARCLSGGGALPGGALPLATEVSPRPDDVVCPDSLTLCPDQTTCCKMVNGSYGCCPMPNAMCCMDNIHCCPEGYTCDLVHSTCVSTSTTSLTPLTYTPAKTSSAVADVKVNAVPCNESVACADGNTCCQTPVGRWACCPLPKAVCCLDHLHCCPHGTVCNLAQSRCDDAQGRHSSLPWLSKLPALNLTTREEVVMVTNSDEKCDRQKMCPSGTTCCSQGSGRWACCPLPQAVCCNDQEHCCPKGYRCNLAQQSCDGPGSGSLPWVRKTMALTRASPQPSRRPPSPPSPAGVQCDAHTACPRDTTCCFMTRSASWGCCPLPKAVCCADGEHCCPSGYTCNAHTASCSRPLAAGLQHMPWFSKHSAMQQGVQQGMLGDVKCDNASSCASGTTCCKLATGEWGCCPLVKAVCCDDHEHCCPQGYTCNMHSGTCEKKLHLQTPRSRPQSKVVQSMLRQSAVEEDVPCDPTGVFHCSKQETCCRTSATEWACCPFAQAVCCADSQHCCPAGSSCDQVVGGCTTDSQPSRPPQHWDGDADLVPLGTPSGPDRGRGGL